MSRQMKYGILAVVVLITVLLVWMLGSDTTEGSSSGKGKIAFVSSNWDDQYMWQSKDPYGLFIFNDLLKDHVKGSSSVNVSDKNILDSLAETKPATFLFLGKEFGMYDEELDTLFKCIENGSDLVLISGNVTENIAASFEPELRFTYDYTRVAQVKYGKTRSELIYLLQQDTLAYPWQMISHPGKYESNTKIISSISGKANFISFPFGKGKIMIHSTPESFFNFQLNRKEGFRYADYVIQEIDPKKDLHYLELGRLKKKEKEDIFEQLNNDSNKGKKDDSYLQFLFQTPALRAALLLALLGVFLFIVFRSRRMQPQVEVLPAKRNMSEIFVQTIASIYRNKDNPFSVLQLHKKNFYNTIQRHFFIDISKRSDHREISHLSSRCGVSSEEIEFLLKRLETANPGKVNEDFLLETIKLKRDFYERTGVISEKVLKRLDDKEIILYRSIWLSFPLLLGGVGLILGGLLMLVQSSGTGILLWPIGSVLLVWGIARMSRPLLKLKADKLVIYGLLNSKKSYVIDQITRAQRSGKGIELYFKNEEKIYISLNEISNTDQIQFNLYLIKHKIIEF
jgi:hypothetical protein